MPYSHFLYELSKFIWLGFVLVLLMTYVLKVGNKSYFIGATVTVIAALTMLAIEPLYLSMASDYQWFVFNFWYFTWATINFIAAVTIYLLHKRDNERFGFVSTSCIVTFVALCLVQSLRHLDVVVLRSDYMGTGFRIAINALNAGFLVWLSHPLYTVAKDKLFRRRMI